jgi:hypothetical protein
VGVALPSVLSPSTVSLSALKRFGSQPLTVDSYRTTMAPPPGPLRVWEVRHERGGGQTPLIPRGVRCGGIWARSSGRD